MRLSNNQIWNPKSFFEQQRVKKDEAQVPGPKLTTGLRNRNVL